MAFELDFLDMMPHTVAVERWTGQDFHSVDQYEPEPYTYRCRIVGKGIAIRRQGGEEDAIIVDIYADTRGDRIQMQDRITLPSHAAWLDLTPVIFSVGNFTDEDGFHHTKVQCGWMYHRQGQ